nr:MAG TPA: hypothetical protein [Caudoviricetes sp.]
MGIQVTVGGDICISRLGTVGMDASGFESHYSHERSSLNYTIV